jgi:hypothetical protein
LGRERGGAGERRPLPTVGIVGSDDTPADLATVAEERTERPRGVIARRVGLGLLVLFVAVGFTGLLGVRSETRHATGDGIDLRVQYGRVSRPGLATPLVIEVRQDGGFDAPIVLELDADYFDLFDLNGLYPSPAAETSQGDRLHWEFDPPDGELLRVSLDARASPARAAPGSTRIAVLDPDGGVLVATDVDTLIVP